MGLNLKYFYIYICGQQFVQSHCKNIFSFPFQKYLSRFELRYLLFLSHFDYCKQINFYFRVPLSLISQVGKVLLSVFLLKKKDDIGVCFTIIKIIMRLYRYLNSFEKCRKINLKIELRAT